MTDELTGILQSRGQEDGQSFVVIDGQRLDTPQYVIDWMAKMKSPLQNGETVLYKKQQDREGGAWRLTKIRRPSKADTTKPAAPQVEQKSGILVKVTPTSCNVQMANGVKIYALSKPLPEVELPQKWEFTIDKQGFILGYKFFGKADVALQENLDRINSPADGETAEPLGGELIKAPPRSTGTDGVTNPQVVKEYLTSSMPADLGICSLTLGGTISIGNYENVKIEIQGPTGYRKEMIEYLKDTCDLLGKDQITRGMINAWKARVLGGAENV